MAELDLAVLARAIVTRLSTDEKPVELACDTPLVLSGRADDLEIAIANLIENAQRYAPEGERVGVAMRASPSGVLVRVENPGAPISPNHLSKIFERFFTTDGASGGTGLGLAIVKSVAEAHGGSIGCRREDDKTVFELRLPRND